MSAGARPVGLVHRLGERLEVELPDADREVFVLVAPASLVQVDVRDPVAVGPNEVGLRPGVLSGDGGVAGVETGRGVGPREQVGEVARVEERRLEVLDGDFEVTPAAVLVESANGVVDALADRLVVPLLGVSVRGGVDDALLRPERHCRVDGGFEFAARALADVFVRGTGVETIREVDEQVHAVLGGGLADRLGIDAPALERPVHVEFHEVEPAVGGEREAGVEVGPVLDGEPLSDGHVSESASRAVKGRRSVARPDGSRPKAVMRLLLVCAQNAIGSTKRRVRTRDSDTNGDETKAGATSRSERGGSTARPSRRPCRTRSRGRPRRCPDRPPRWSLQS